MQTRPSATWLVLATILLAVTAATAQSNTAPPSPKDQFVRIETAQKEALDRYGAELQAAKGDDSRFDEIANRYTTAVHKNANDALDLVRQYPQDPIVVDVLRFVIRTARMGPASYRAIEILARDHVIDGKMGEVCGEIDYLFSSAAAESLIRDVLKRHPNRDDRGLACYALANALQYRARLLRKIKKEPALVDQFEETSGKGSVTWLLRDRSAESLESEAAKMLERVISEFSNVPDVYSPRPLGTVAEGQLFALRHLQVGKVAPEIVGQDVEGSSFKLGDYRGKVVVLTFSGEWCGPCTKMYPQLRDLLTRHKDVPFTIVSVNTDQDPATLRNAIAAGKMTWRSWWDRGKTGPITTRWGVRLFPAIFVLDPKGVIRFVEVRGDALEKAVDDLLREVSADKPKP